MRSNSGTRAETSFAPQNRDDILLLASGLAISPSTPRTPKPSPRRGQVVNPNPNLDSGERESNPVPREQDPVAMDSEDIPNLGVSSEEGVDSDMIESFPEEQRLDFSSAQNERSRGNSDSVSQSVDFDRDGDSDVHGSVVGHSKYSEPYFLRMVLRDELGEDDSDHAHRRLVIAVHAVMLESGFVGNDPVTGMRADRFCLSDQWPSKAFILSLRYSLPELVAGVGNMPEGVVLKFLSWAHFMGVYGFLRKGESGFYRLGLDERRFGPVIDLMWEKNEKNAEKKECHGSSCSYPEKEVREFWKIVKDGLVLPLLIDLRERVGLPLPSCFMCLPAELKLKISELLTGVGLANIGCVSSELRYLASNYDLWKRRYADEFGEPVEIQGSVNWKQRFARSWEAKKKWRNLEFSLWQVPPLYLLPNRFRAPNQRDDTNGHTRSRVSALTIVRDAYWCRNAWVDSYLSLRWVNEDQVLRMNPAHSMARILSLDSLRTRPNTSVLAEELRLNAGPTRPSCGLD